MRSIEEIAAEEEGRIQELWKARFKAFSGAAGLGFGLWGWVLFQQGQMDKGAVAVVGSLVLFGAAWDSFEVFRQDLVSNLIGVLSALGPFFLYFYSCCPSFYWGKDPSFWLAVHGGAVVEPFWSPLAYLLGQAACFLFPQRQSWILPELSGAVMAGGFYLAALDFWGQLKSRNLLNAFLVPLVCWILALSQPFWNIATLGSGLVSGLGFLLFILQRRLLDREEKPWKTLFLLVGLLWSVHPLWGIIGLWNQMGSLDPDALKKGNLLPLALGFTPYLWIPLRAGRFFPSWGGSHPFVEVLRKWQSLWQAHLQGDWSLGAAVLSAGSLAAALSLLVLVLWSVHFFKWRMGNKKVLPTVDFWTWLAAGAGAVLFYSQTSGTLGPTAPWFTAGLGLFSLRFLERGMEKRQPEFFSGPNLGWTVAAFLAGALGLGLYLNETFFRSRTDFPEQHALNLLKGLGEKSVLVCEDPFEASACLQTRLFEPIALQAPILEKRFLVQRWYVAQCIDRYPQLLFSSADGQADKALKSFVENNRDEWQIQWALSAVPRGWEGPKCFSTVLTEVFEGKAASPLEMGDFQYRYDLSSLLSADRSPRRGPSKPYFERYISGFEQLGKDLMEGGRYLDSIRAFERALLLDPSAGMAKKYLAQMYAQRNILEAARLDFEKTVRETPPQVEQLMDEMGAADKNKDESRVAALLDRIVHLNTQLAEAQYQLSKIYDQEGRSQEAKALLEASVQSNPRQLEAQLKLGHLMDRLGNRIRAEEAYRAVLTIDPQNKEAQVEIWKLLNQK